MFGFVTTVLLIDVWTEFVIWFWLLFSTGLTLLILGFAKLRSDSAFALLVFAISSDSSYGF